MLRGQERRLARKITIGIASMMLGLMPLNIASADAGNAGESAADVQLPDKGNVEFGKADITTPILDDTHAVMDIVQTTDKAVIAWDSFNVGKASTVNFIQMKDGALNPAASTLNRVTGNNLSEIAGTINSVGSFILINPNGAIFTEGSTVNAAGIIVSTEHLGGTSESSYRDGSMMFDQSKEKNNNIIMNGTMHAETGTDKTTKSVANAILAHIKELNDKKTDYDKAAQTVTPTDEAAAAAKAVNTTLDAIKATAGKDVVLNVTTLKPATG